ncbi:phosphoribosylformylglycinamidine synthase [Echinicola strongylocentroti]|uniref:Phosphoribosylformylglycinamidine synthase n=1 Tax=Echinicola strongylocentroti TaxID=1795355 RepID=A0A2Z4ID89_9BACT|nr:HAEPLYID family protein [Echinicola strongylocentroti]AWW28972.1 phosphoribosylformylglycinamidine synthase [Echinicola strongylocentroti]
MNLKISVVLLLFASASKHCYAQLTDSTEDSLFINSKEANVPDKVFHAEPLYIDLIRDLGARKGEKEWNLGLGLTDNARFDSYEALIEYEWAPIDRLGLEVELPFTFYSPLGGTPKTEVPANRLNSLKVAAQWTFFVNKDMGTSMAIGYINEFQLADFGSFGKPLIIGNGFNPFYIIAKRWGSNFHSLIYTGPIIERDFEFHQTHTSYAINPSFHYMIPGTKNFIGIECDQVIDHGDFDMTLRPQMRVGVADNLLVGIVAGIPVQRENERFSSFVRLIWEPSH